MEFWALQSYDLRLWFKLYHANGTLCIFQVVFQIMRLQICFEWVLVVFLLFYKKAPEVCLVWVVSLELLLNGKLLSFYPFSLSLLSFKPLPLLLKKSFGDLPLSLLVSQSLYCFKHSVCESPLLLFLLHLLAWVELGEHRNLALLTGHVNMTITFDPNGLFWVSVAHVSLLIIAPIKKMLL